MTDPRMFLSGSDDRGESSEAGRRLYNPYQDLNMHYSYRTLYDLPTSPEFLFKEEELAQRRSWGENLTFYTGVGYLSGAVGGAALGLRDAARGAEPGETAKIRANRVLNSCGSSGRRVGNTLGVIGFMYAGIESGRAPWWQPATATTGSTASLPGSAPVRSSAPPTARGPPSSRAPSVGSSPRPPWGASSSPSDMCLSYDRAYQTMKQSVGKKSKWSSFFVRVMIFRLATPSRNRGLPSLIDKSMLR